MAFHSQTLRLRLSLLLAASLLLLGWFQLHHELTAHLEHPDTGCVVCVFTGHLGDGATASIPVLHTAHFPYRLAAAPGYTAPVLTQPFRLALSQRGPPAHSSLI
jgi:hypothetical protein